MLSWRQSGVGGGLQDRSPRGRPLTKQHLPNQVRWGALVRIQRRPGVRDRLANDSGVTCGVVLALSAATPCLAARRPGMTREAFQRPIAAVRGALLDALRPRDSAELPSFSRLQLDAQRRAPCAYKNGFSSFFQIFFKVCQIVGVPELRQLFNGISVWRPLPFYRFFHRLYRSFSFRVIGRAVTGKPLALGN